MKIILEKNIFSHQIKNQGNSLDFKNRFMNILKYAIYIINI